MQRLGVRVTATWAAATGIAADRLSQPGTTLVLDPRRGDSDAIGLWPVGPHTIVEVAPARAAAVRGVLDRRPAGHRLTADDLLLGLTGPVTAHDRVRLLALDPDRFRPADPAPGAVVRRLGDADLDIVDACLRRCPAQDRREADVEVEGHERAVGVVVGSRVIAVASVIDWRGFADIGVLTDPGARGRGAASAAVSRLCEELVDDPRVVLYRHLVVNTPSRKVADRLGLVGLGEGEGVGLCAA